MTELQAPHRSVRVRNKKEEFLVRLFDSLWERYRSRMEYVRKYEEIVAAHGATFVNDHIAFRTFAVQRPCTGIFLIGRIAQALGYSPAGAYEFPDKHLSSLHYQPPNPQLPKLFVTELKTWELSSVAQNIVHRNLKKHRPPLSDDVLTRLHGLEDEKPSEIEKLLKTLTRFFHDLPWELPQKKDVLALNEETQFGAWVLVNGYEVNHFTASVDSHQVPALSDIEKTVAAMRAAGIPMKKEIEGERGSRLRQSSTEAVVIPVRVKEGKGTKSLPWTYAYFEIAERPALKDPATGKIERFEGFLGGQATNLFEMTKVK